MEKSDPVLVLLTPAFPANEFDENWVPSQQLFVKYVKKINKDIKVIVLAFIYPDKKSIYSWHESEVISFDGSRMKKYKRPFLWRHVFNKLKMIHEKNKISGILSFWCGECALVGHYFSRLYKIKHLIWICGQDARQSNKMVRFIRPSAAELVAKSDFLMEEFYKNHGIKPLHLVPNGIDPSIFSKAEGKRDIDIIGAGSLSFMKQYNIFLEVVAELKKDIPGIKAVLVGDGEHAEGLTNMLQKLSLQDNLELKGMLAPGETIQLMQRSKIFLHPSSYEGFSMACLEALYAGAHVISFTQPMLHEIKNWHIVKTKDQMLQKTHGLLNDSKIIFEPVLAYRMDKSAKKMLNLLGLVD